MSEQWYALRNRIMGASRLRGLPLALRGLTRVPAVRPAPTGRSLQGNPRRQILPGNKGTQRLCLLGQTILVQQEKDEITAEFSRLTALLLPGCMLIQSKDGS